MSDPVQASCQNAAPLITAARIAEELRLDKRSVLARMAAIPAEKTLVRGQWARAWPVHSLPREWSAELTSLALKRGYRDAAHMLASPCGRWSPPLPLDSLNREDVEKAVKLRDALAAPLRRQHTLTGKDLIELGLAEHQRVFGRAISAMLWQKLFDRTVQRDRGLGEWMRVEIYLEDEAFLRPKLSRQDLQDRHLHLALEEQIKQLENKAAPTMEDKEFLLHAAFVHYEALVQDEADSAKQRAVRTSLAKFLLSAVPGLAKTQQAFHKLFQRALQKWQLGGRSHRALQDRRRLASGNFRTPDFAGDLAKIRNGAIIHGGSESLAYRKLRQHGELSAEFVDYHHFDPRRNKSYVPKSVRKAVTPEVEMTLPLYRGPKQARMAGPWIPRDWSEVLPGDYLSGDDVSWNHYTYDTQESGEIYVGRGECLLFTDLRTGYPLEFVWIQGKYNGRFIRSGLLKIHDEIGLPRKGAYFEKGVWASRWIPGESKHWLPWRETECGLQELGFDFDVRHATTPRAKPIEGLFRILQERMRSEPGFAGFNERTERMERMQEFLARVRRGKEHPGNELLSTVEWAKRVRQILQEFAHDPQNGRMLPGVSPAEMWEQAIAERPLRKLPDEARFLLATHREVRPVKLCGIRIHAIKDYLYCNDRTADFIGHKVLTYYHVDHPELLTVSDLNRQTFFTVKGIRLKAMSATKEEQAEAHAQIGRHTSRARAIFGQIQHRLVSTVTKDNNHDEATKELGRFHNAEVERHKSETVELNRKLRRIEIETAAGQITANPEIRNADRVLAGAELEKNIRERIARKAQMASATEGGLS